MLVNRCVVAADTDRRLINAYCVLLCGSGSIAQEARMSDVVAGLLALRVHASLVVGGDSVSLSLSFLLSSHDACSPRLIAHRRSRARSFSLSRTSYGDGRSVDGRRPTASH